MKNQRGFARHHSESGFAAVLVLLIILGIAALVGVSYYFGVNKIGSNINIPTSIPTASVLPIASQLPNNEMANWKAYTSPVLSVTFLHPPNFAVEELPGEPMGNFIFVTFDWRQLPEPYNKPNGRQMTVNKTNFKYDKDLQQILNLQIGKSYKNPLDTMNDTVTKRLPNQQIDKLNFFVFDQYSEGSPSQRSKLYYSKIDGDYLQIAFSDINFDKDTPISVAGRDIDYISTFNQILLTFKFTNPTSLKPLTDIMLMVDNKDYSSYFMFDNEKFVFDKTPVDYPGKVIVSPDEKFACVEYGTSGYWGYNIFDMTKRQTILSGGQYSYCVDWLSQKQLKVKEVPYDHQDQTTFYLIDPNTLNKAIVSN